MGADKETPSRCRWWWCLGEPSFNATRQMEKEGFAELVSIAAHSQNTADLTADDYGIKGYTSYQEMIEQENLDLVQLPLQIISTEKSLYLL